MVHQKSSKPPLLLNMVLPLFLKMLHVATVTTVALFIIMSMADAYAARRILHGHAPPSTFNPKAMEYSQSRQYPPHVLLPPSAPNPGTHIPSSSWRQRKSPPHPFAGDHNNVSSSLGGTQYPPHVPVPPSAPNPGTHIPSSSWRHRKNLPRPYMLHGAYYQGTHIPAASTASTTAPMLGTP